MSITKLHDFLIKPINFQIQSMFEFRYPVLFNNDSFLIEQLNLPQIEANTGLVYLDGYPIPVHSTAKFGSNEVSFSMYVEEDAFHYETGKYFKIFNSLLNNDHKLLDELREYAWVGSSSLVAEITPIGGKLDENYKYPDLKNENLDDKTIVLYNALIKSCSLSGGFSSNSTTLAKFDISMTFSLMDNLQKIRQY